MKVIYRSDDPRKLDELLLADLQSRLEEVTMLAAVYEQLLENPDISKLERRRCEAFLAVHRRGIDHIEKRMDEPD